MKTILVPIDFSEASDRVIDAARTLAQVIDARIVLMHVVQAPMVVAGLGPFVGEALRFTAEVERGARRHLRSLQTRLAKRSVKVDTLCEQGSPVDLITKHAKALDARYVVVGSHGRTAFYDLVVGSTTSGVFKRASCPVVVVPSAPARRKAERTARKVSRVRSGVTKSKSSRGNRRKPRVDSK